jgi:hypothetical protein
MPVVINEIVIRSNIEKPEVKSAPVSEPKGDKWMEEVVKQSVEKVLEILEEKKQR